MIRVECYDEAHSRRYVVVEGGRCSDDECSSAGLSPVGIWRLGALRRLPAEFCGDCLRDGPNVCARCGGPVLFVLAVPGYSATDSTLVAEGVHE